MHISSAPVIERRGSICSRPSRTAISTTCFSTQGSLPVCALCIPFDIPLTSIFNPPERRKDKGNDLPPELQEQWGKDRQKKAENKKKRALERMKLAADPLAMHKGGKKGRKAMLAAARAQEDIPNRIVDFATLEQQIRRFLADIDGSHTMVLPPCDKETRKHIHDLAGAFNLKSQSKGNGTARYTTLIKTSKSGIGIKEGKIRAIMKAATNGTWDAPRSVNWRAKANLAKHREGEEVGKVSYLRRSDSIGGGAGADYRLRV